MEKVLLRVLTLAAAVVAPHLIAIDAKAIEVKHLDKLSVEERASIKDLTEKAIYVPEEEEPIKP